ncbi:MAG: serine/threonine-protein kinase [Gemmataceae bacterium]
MRLDCPQCGTALEFSRVAPRFCSHCGSPLGSEVQTLPPRRPSEATTLPGGKAPADPQATLAYGAPRRLGRHPEAVGRYRLLRTLGGGGMGTVFEAEEEVTARRVALKLIRPEFADSHDAVERFRREGRLASALFHPRCVFVLAADEEAGQPYIVMELMPGKNLGDLVAERGPLPVEEAVTKILDVVEGLQEAHRLGVVHRDVKPSNCFLDEDGRVKVGDFGLAKSLVGPEQLTRSGSFLGTVLFASPEQIRNEPVDPQTDVYSVCATLYYLLTGRAPFQDDDPTAALARAVSDPPPSMRKYRKDVPRTLDEVVLRGLAKSRRARWQDLEELRLALLPFLGGPAVVPEVGWRVTAFLLDLLLILPLGLALGKLVAVLAPASQARVWPLLSPLLGLVCGVVYFGLPEWLVGCSPGKYAAACGSGRAADGATGRRCRGQPVADVPVLPRAGRRRPGRQRTDGDRRAGGRLAGRGARRQRDHAGRRQRAAGGGTAVPVVRRRAGGAGLDDAAAQRLPGPARAAVGTRVIRLPRRRPPFRSRAKAGWPAKAALPDGVPERVGSYDVLLAARPLRTPDEMVLARRGRGSARTARCGCGCGAGGRVTAARRGVARDARPRLAGRRRAGRLAVGRLRGGDRRRACSRHGAEAAPTRLARRAVGAGAAGGGVGGGGAGRHLAGTLKPGAGVGAGVGAGDAAGRPAREPALVRTPMNLLRQAAAVALEGQPRPHGERDRPIRAPIPWHASALMGRLMGSSGAEEPFVSLAQAREELAKAHELPEEISRPGRGLQVGLMFAGMTPGMLCLFGLGPVVMLIAYIVCVLGAATGEFARDQAEACLAETDEAATPDLAREYREELARVDRELGQLTHDREVVLASWSWFVVNRLRASRNASAGVAIGWRATSGWRTTRARGWTTSWPRRTT